MSTLLLDSQVEIPDGIDSVAAFREWALSTEFPAQGRIDYIAGRIEVDMSPDNIFFHSAPKSELAYGIGHRLRTLDLGEWYIDKTRVSCPDVGLSVEPDIVVITHESLTTGRVTLTPTADRKQDSFIEIEGPPDLVVEIVSDSSVAKDTRRLPKLYFEAGVTEYWIVDARGAELQFELLRRGTDGYAASPDAEGWQRSDVLEASYRLTRFRNRSGHWQYRLEQRRPAD